MTTPDPIERVEALIDGVVGQGAGRSLLTDADKRIGSLHFALPQRDAKISAIAYNANGASQPASIKVLWSGPGREDKATLYVLAIGVTRYQAKGLPEVSFPAKDAHDFVALAKAAGWWSAIWAGRDVSKVNTRAWRMRRRRATTSSTGSTGSNTRWRIQATSP